MFTKINVLGTPLQSCCKNPITGFFRDGFCNTSNADVGMHTVCVIITREFLIFSKTIGNDLSTSVPELNFVGLEPGDQWCLCAGRWLEAYNAGFAPKVILEATHEETLAIIPLKYLQECMVYRA